MVFWTDRAPIRLEGERMSSGLPARVRITKPLLPLSPALAKSVETLCPTKGTLTEAAVAVAGGSVIGAYVRWDGGEAINLMPAWRGKGIEEALQKAL